MLVIATAPGFYGSLRQAGDKFEVPDDEPESSWLSQIDDKGNVIPWPKSKGKAKPSETVANSPAA